MDLPRLKLWRQRRALALRDLAVASGVGVSTISLLERGKAAARPSTVRKLAAALAVDPMALMAEPGEDDGVGEDGEDRR